MKLWKKISLSLAALTGVIIAAGIGIGWWISTPSSPETSKRIAASPQFKEGGFVNIEPQAPTEITMKDLSTALASHPRTSPQGEIPVVEISADLLKSPPAPGLRMAWIGHATVMIEMDGKRILTDPVFAARVSPFSFVGPKRFHKPPLALEDLTGIDAVVVTHNHYDHFEKQTAQHLAKQGTRFFVPLGSKPQLTYWGVAENQIEEMEWWQETKLGDITFVATPSRHYSNRGTFDYKGTLWASWSIIGPQNRVFVSGDTGYSKVFTEIGEKFGPFDATIIKVGAYGPGQSWLDVHMTPEESMQVHKDLKGEAMLPVHWGTFNLAYHPWDEPIIRSLEAAQKMGVKLFTPKIGEMFEPASQPKLDRWWEEVDQSASASK